MEPLRKGKINAEILRKKDKKTSNALIAEN
jgi:hypothetical protein